MNTATFAFLEFNRFKDILLRFTSSPLGGQRVNEMSVFTHAERIERELEKTSEGMRLIQTRGEIRFSGIEDPSGIFQRLKIEEAVLEPLEMLALLRLIEAGLDIRAKLRSKTFRGFSEEFPELSHLAREIHDFKSITGSINGKILPSGEVADSASPELARIRDTIRHIKNRVQTILDGYLQRRESDKLLQDYFITIRNNRFVIPVKIEQKRSIPGVIHGVSSSGATVFLEPFECIELNNELTSLQDQEKEEIRRILAEFTRQFRREFSNLVRLTERIAEFDFILAKADFGVRFNCCKPQINSEGVLSFSNARHPLLEEALTAQGEEVVPISLKMNRENNALIISGPNTGGKTVSLKTVGLLTLIAHAGLHVPAEAASIPALNQVLADIGDNQSIAESLSTFSSHILNISQMVNELRLPALVLLDEVGTGTNPDQEAALGIAIVDYFKTKGALIIATTHHNGIKAYAFNTPGVVSAAMEFDERSLKPTYRLVVGLAGGSSGIEMAQRLGLKRDIVEAAKSLINRKDIEVEEYLGKIKRKLLELEERVSSVKNREAELKAEKARLEKEHEEKERERRLVLENKVHELVSSFTGDAERFLKEINDESIRLKLAKQISRKATGLKSDLRKRYAAGPEEPAPAVTPKVGDWVLLRSLSLSGVVTKVTDQVAEIDVGGKKVKGKISEIELVEKKDEPTPSLSLPSGVRLELEQDEKVQPELNIIGCTVSEALDRTDKFLDRASLVNLDTVRLIHGHGTGRLRRALAEFLREHPHVASFEQNESYGGVTLVRLKD